MTSSWIPRIMGLLHCVVLLIFWIAPATRLKVVLFLALSLCIACPDRTIAQDKIEQTAEQTLRDRLVKRSQEMIEAASFHITIDDKKQTVPVRKTSLLSHTDTERGEQGGLWLIGEEGRPIALASIWTEPDVSIWHCEVRSLSTEPGVGGSLMMPGIPNWYAKSPGVKFFPIPDRNVDGKRKTLKPVKSSNLRLSQMKLQARRFSGYEKWRGRHELRVLPSELYRYKDPENGIVDGALFAIAHNTNTECYLMIEVQEKNGVQDWYYALARFCYAEVHVSIDKKEVWTEPQIGNGATAGQNDAYFTFPRVPKSPALRRQAN